MAFLRAIATLKENTIKLLKSDNGNNRSIDSIISYHRRTGNFLPGGGGGGKPFAQKNLAGCPNFYERVGKKGGPYYNNVGRTGI